MGFGGKSLAPTTREGRVVTIFYSFFGIVVLFVNVSALLGAVTVEAEKRIEQAFEERRVEARKREQNREEAARKDLTPEKSEGDDHDYEYAQTSRSLSFWTFYGTSLALHFSILLALVLVAAGIFQLTELQHEKKWPTSPPSSDSCDCQYLDAVFFTWITITAIGYGDDFITTEASMIWCVRATLSRSSAHVLIPPLSTPAPLAAPQVHPPHPARWRLLRDDGLALRRARGGA